MIKSRSWLFALSTLALAASVAQADPIAVTGSSGGWQNVSSYTIGETGTPFWNQASMDGSQLNVGYFLTKTGGFAGNSASPNLSTSSLQFWGTGSGGSDSAEALSTIFAVTSALHLEVAGYSGVNEFGWYNTSDAAGSEVLHTLFSGPTSPVTTGPTFSPSGSFGLYLKTVGGTYFSESSRNGAGETTHQHFAIFKDTATGKLWIGVEDLPLTGTGVENGGDYNDMVVSLSAVPEPSSMALLTLGALSFAGYGLRRRNRK
ncbi:MAG: PEP-CTERM sorting domain-containing protein [Gemmataceae bacterium]|nr:PEP-CTERM sorting domain-containing protein [Gemmataceae bacterium]